MVLVTKRESKGRRHVSFWLSWSFVFRLVECCSWFLGCGFESWSPFRLESEYWPVVAVSSGIHQDSREKPGAAGKIREGWTTKCKVYKLYLVLALLGVCMIRVWMSVRISHGREWVCLFPENKCPFLLILVSQAQFEPKYSVLVF